MVPECLQEANLVGLKLTLGAAPESAFAGGGRAEFDTSDVDILTTGFNLYFDGGVVGYRFFSFDNEGTDPPGRWFLPTR